MSKKGDRGLAVAARDRFERLAAIGTYTAAIVHELSSPLAATRAALASARSASSEADLRRWLDAIERSTERETGLLEGVLRFAREGELGISERALEGILRCAEHAVQDDIAASNLSVRIDVGADAQTARCNAAALEQVLIDLLRNAAEASSDPVQVLIRARRDGDTVLLTVTDDGPGLGDDDPERVFAPGYSTKEFHAGLGLFFARALVVAQCGELVARRGPGGGTEFELRLPHGLP